MNDINAMFKTLTFLLLLISSSSFGQRHRTVDIKKIADSLIVSVVGQYIFNQHYQFDSTFRNDQVEYDKDQQTQHISLTFKKVRKFKFIAVDYLFYIKKYEQPWVQTRVILDKGLHLVYPVDTSFIPKFILEKTGERFLSQEQALGIAKLRFKKQGVRIDLRIYYDPSPSKYVWEITNVLEEFGGGGRSVEVLVMDPLTGETITFSKGLQGTLH